METTTEDTENTEGEKLLQTSPERVGSGTQITSRSVYSEYSVVPSISQTEIERGTHLERETEAE